MAELPSVLIVDDEPSIVELICAHLAPSYRTRTASDGAQALGQFLVERPHAVLLDMDMPRMSGLEALQEMRKIDPAVPVIMLTGVQDVALLAAALGHGAFSYLPKPYRPLYLEHVLAAALSQRGREPRS
jgi:two-component system, NtrC family, response regulator AtoC